MTVLPTAGADLISQIRAAAPEATVQELEPPGGARVTLAYMPGLMAPGDLERLVLEPLTRGIPSSAPADLARCCLFPAPVRRVAATADALLDGLFEGLAILHVTGHPAALLLGTGESGPAGTAFGPDLTSNEQLLVRALRSPRLRLRREPGARVVSLEGAAKPQTVAAMAVWATGREAAKTSLLTNLLTWLRLPETVQVALPATAAGLLERGYVAVLAEHLPPIQVGPCTLELLFTGVRDGTMPPPLRRMLLLPRILLANVPLLLGAFFAAISAYHHALMPGPFLMVLAAGRENQPFPIFVEVLALQVLDNGLHAGAERLGGARFTVLATIGTILAATLAFHTGLVGPLSSAVNVLSAIALLVLPGPTLTQKLRIWRFLFLLAGVGLGIFGIGMLYFVLFAYLGEEKRFGLPLRRTPEVVSP